MALVVRSRTRIPEKQAGSTPTRTAREKALVYSGQPFEGKSSAFDVTRYVEGERVLMGRIHRETAELFHTAALVSGEWKMLQSSGSHGAASAIIVSAFNKGAA